MIIGEIIEFGYDNSMINVNIEHLDIRIKHLYDTEFSSLRSRRDNNDNGMRFCNDYWQKYTHFR